MAGSVRRFGLPIIVVTIVLPLAAGTTLLGGVADRCEEMQPIATRCGGADPPLITDQNVYQAATLPEPSPRSPYRDPVFGRCVTRLTDRTSDIATGDQSKGLKNEYSRVQSFNADESLILIRGTEATWYLYRADTLQPLGILPIQGSVDPRWDAHDPSLLYYMDETRLKVFLVQTGENAIVHEFANDFSGLPVATVWTRYEGSPSLDGRYWGFMAQDSSSKTIAFLVYDQIRDLVIAKRDMRAVPGANDVDSVTISPLGTYFVAQFAYCPAGTLGTDANPCGLMVYDAGLGSGRGLVRNIGHSDLALDAQGREVMVYQQLDTDYLSFVDLATGQSTDLWPIDFSHTPMGFHISGRGYKLPGWALVSTHDQDPVSYTWMDDQLFAMELKAGGRVARLAHHHSIVNQGGGLDYFAEPQASSNRDFTKFLFTTNWGRTGTDQVETYLVEMEPGWEGSCAVECSANVPATAKVGAATTFQGSAALTNCQGAAAYDWNFGDVTPHGSGQSTTHAYLITGTYTWTLTATADQRACATSGEVQVSQSGTCALTCSAEVPAQGAVGQPVAFTGSATPAGCSGGLSWDWDFGDGTAHAAESSPTHTYDHSGAFRWKAVASADGVTCTKEGTVTVPSPEAPPVISGVTKISSPFRLKIMGSAFQEGVQVFIGSDQQAWANTTRKGEGILILKQGAALKARFPAGVAVSLRVANPDGQWATATYTR